MRELLERAPGLFQQAVRGRLETAPESAEARYVVALLSSRGMLLSVLQELFSADQRAAASIAGLARRLDPGFERLVARALADSARSGGARKFDPVFLLGVLESIRGAPEILFYLENLRNSSQPRIRSRMAILAGKAGRAHEWLNGLFGDPDARVRANAIEALWCSNDDFATELFARGVQDAHHRVVANALVGQYLQGDAAATQAMERMAGSPDPAFQAAAVWAMGRTGDASFAGVLRALRKRHENSPLIAQGALRALIRIGQATRAAAKL